MMALSRTPKLKRSMDCVRSYVGNFVGVVLVASIVEQGDAAGPPGGRLLDLDRKTAHFETEGRQRFEIGQLFHVAIADLTAGLVAFPDQARIAGFEKTLGGERKR